MSVAVQIDYSFVGARQRIDTSIQRCFCFNVTLEHLFLGTVYSAPHVFNLDEFAQHLKDLAYKRPATV